MPCSSNESCNSSRTKSSCFHTLQARWSKRACKVSDATQAGHAQRYLVVPCCQWRPLALRTVRASNDTAISAAPVAPAVPVAPCGPVLPTTPVAPATPCIVSWTGHALRKDDLDASDAWCSGRSCRAGGACTCYTPLPQQHLTNQTNRSSPPRWLPWRLERPGAL